MFDNTISKLPDIWFDWYARLIPGVIGVVLYLVLSGTIEGLPGGGELLSILFIGYLLGHILQPAVGFAVKRIEKSLGNEAAYARAKNNDGISQSSLNKISKAHAEANSLLACTLVVTLNAFWFWGEPNVRYDLLVGLALYCLLMSVERVFARNRKINDLSR